jgi:hypothetical protein
VWSPAVDRTYERPEAAQRTGKIEREVGEHHTTLRLIGHLQAEHLEAGMAARRRQKLPEGK